MKDRTFTTAEAKKIATQLGMNLEEIDIDELTKEREKFAGELIKLEEVAKMMKNLEKEVINYRQGSIKKELETQPQTEVDVSVDKQNNNQNSLNMKSENM